VFSGNNTDGHYECSLKLKGEIDVEVRSVVLGPRAFFRPSPTFLLTSLQHEDTKYGVKARLVDFHLIKKDKGRWEQLLEDKKLGKVFVKVCQSLLRRDWHEGGALAVTQIMWIVLLV